MQFREDWLFGKPAFHESEEYQEFQFKFLIVVMFSGAVLTAILVFADLAGLNDLHSRHLYSMQVFTVSALALWLALRGRKERFQVIAWLYEGLCLLEFTSALALVPADELRILWFVINVPCVYILLGQGAGLAVSLITLIGLAGGNAYLSAPYSPNALVTVLLGTAYLAVVFHVYGGRSVSYFVRMRESVERLQYLAGHDMLTGALNARAYYQQCDQLMRIARRSNTPFAVLFVDLDHFKAINDKYGHAAGDAVLKAVAGALAGNIRASDILGRIGGEEFSIFLMNAERDNALKLAEHLRRAVESLRTTTGAETLQVTASIGVASHEQGAADMREIQQRADQAMYVAKSQGRNRVSQFEAEQAPALKLVS